MRLGVGLLVLTGFPVSAIVGCGGDELPIDKTFTTAEVTVDSDTRPLESDQPLVVRFLRVEGEPRITWKLCNSNTARISPGGGKLRVAGGGLSTLKFCEDVPKAEQQAVSRFFRSDPDWSYDGSELSLEGEDVSFELSERDG